MATFSVEVLVDENGGLRMNLEGIRGEALGLAVTARDVALHLFNQSKRDFTMVRLMQGLNDLPLLVHDRSLKNIPLVAGLAPGERAVAKVTRNRDLDVTRVQVTSTSLAASCFLVYALMQHALKVVDKCPVPDMVRGQQEAILHHLMASANMWNSNHERRLRKIQRTGDPRMAKEFSYRIDCQAQIEQDNQGRITVVELLGPPLQSHYTDPSAIAEAMYVWWTPFEDVFSIWKHLAEFDEIHIDREAGLIKATLHIRCGIKAGGKPGSADGNEKEYSKFLQVLKDKRLYPSSSRVLTRL